MSAGINAEESDRSPNVKMDKYEATRHWLENQDKESACDSVKGESELEDLESIAESSVVESSDGDYESDTEEDAITTQTLGTQIATTEMSSLTRSLKELFNSINSIQTVGNVNIENSTGVHIGNITNINGNIQIIHAGDKITQRSSREKRSTRRKEQSPHISPEINLKKKVVEKEERIDPNAFQQPIKFRIPKGLCAIIPRHTWLAQLPMDEYKYLEEPVKYVVISHTATESSEKQAINIRMIRDIQCFHIESRGWNDIAYNFLIGCDGNVYEGRGWGVVGAHTRGYNIMSLGISFIGCFMRVLPNQAAINACKNLLKRGIEEGHLAADYRLVCHCQCTSTESPGRKLYEEIQTWEHFYDVQSFED